MKELTRLETLAKEFEQELEQVKYLEFRFHFEFIKLFFSFALHFVTVLTHYN
jgi:hypothetical protein